MKKTNLFAAIILVMLLFMNGILVSQNIINGTITYQSDNLKPLDDVQVGLFDLSNNLIMVTTTDIDGFYTFNNVPSDKFYIRVTSNQTMDLPDLMDVYLVHQHLISNIVLDGPKFEAADINNNGQITGYDFGRLTSSLASGSFSQFEDWQFEEVFIDYSARTFVSDTIDFWGTLEGDVDNSWEPSGRAPSVIDFINAPSKIISSSTNTLSIGSSFSGLVSGFHLNISFPSDIIEIINISGPDGDVTYNVDEANGTLSVIWVNLNGSDNCISGNNLFEIEVSKISDAFVGISDFELLSGGMVLDQGGKKISDVQIILPSVESLDLAVDVNIYPNPVSDRLNFDIQNPETEYFNVKLFDQTGKLIKDINSDMFEAGLNSFDIDVKNLMPGNYFYVVRNSNSKFVLPGQFVKIL